MALNGRILGKNISNALENMDTQEVNNTDKIWEIIGEQIIKHIKELGEVTVKTEYGSSILSGTGKIK